MRVLSIETENHDFFGNTKFDFTDANGNSVDTIIIAGENGSGKTQLLKSLYRLAKIHYYVRGEDVNFIFRETVVGELDHHLLEYFQSMDWGKLKESFSKKLTGRIRFSVLEEKSKGLMGFGKLFFEYKELDGKSKWGEVSVPGVYFSTENEKKILGGIKSLYSSADTHYLPSEIQTITANVLDKSSLKEDKTEGNFSTQIAQLLVDIYNADANDTAKWLEQNPVGRPSDRIRLRRQERFTNAYRYMFGDELKFLTVKQENGNQKIVFTKNGREIELSELSSGERNIIFRGAFFLRNQQGIENSLILIDEPELSLNPVWQKKILNYYKKIFSNSTGEQQVQIFVATHSPFVIHNENRYNDKVIVLSTENGQTIIKDNGKFASWTSEEIIEEAYNIKDFSQIPTDKPIVFVEGETDEKYIKTYLELIGKTDWVDIRCIGHYGKKGSKNTGEAALTKLYDSLSMQPNFIPYTCIFLYDCDVEKVNRDNGTLYVRSLQKIEDKVYKRGIENLLTLSSDFGYENYQKVTKNVKTEYGVEYKIKDIDKVKLCNDICGSTNKEDYFKEFDQIKTMLEEILS